MSRITIIAAIDMNGALGKNGAIPWHIPSEFKHFKKETMGKNLIMGRSTYESIGKPLPGRTIRVLSSGDAPADLPQGVTFHKSLEDSLRACGEAEEIMIAGGADVYRQFIPLASRMVISVIPKEVKGADAFFPEIETDNWESLFFDDMGEFTVATYEREAH